MALTWWRHHSQPRAKEPEQSVAEVVHQLQDLAGELRKQAGRLERVNERVEQSSKESP